MVAGCVVCLALQLGGNAVAFITLASQVIIGLTNATIVGGVFAMAAWLPQKYVQVCFWRTFLAPTFLYSL